MEVPQNEVPKHGNQYKPCPPDTIIRPWVDYYAKMGLSNPKIHSKLLRHRRFDVGQYQLSEKTLARRRRGWGHVGTRGAGWTIENIGPHLEKLREKYPKMGAGDMKANLRHQDILVSRKTILDYMKTHYPEEVRGRTRRRLKRKRFWAAGVNDVWALDQHDKWRRFQLFLHVGLEPFSGYILWAKVWWTNRNPRLICSYYLDAILRTEGMPVCTQSDPGSENYGVANAQTTMRHTLDPSLGEALQHRWMRDHQNVKPEIFWSQLWRRWTPGYEDLLDIGYNTGVYDPNKGDERVVFHWLFIPWLQSELDEWVNTYNLTSKRRDKNSILPHGPPELIFNEPESYEVNNFKLRVDQDLIDETRHQYAEPGHPVHKLVPDIVDNRLSVLYAEMGSPVITRENIWDTYSDLLILFREREVLPDVIAAINLVISAPPVGENPADKTELLPWPDARMGDPVIGTGSGHVDQDVEQEKGEDEQEKGEVDEDSSDDQSDDTIAGEALCVWFSD